MTDDILDAAPVYVDIYSCPDRGPHKILLSDWERFRVTKDDAPCHCGVKNCSFRKPHRRMKRKDEDE